MARRLAAVLVLSLAMPLVAGAQVAAQVSATKDTRRPDPIAALEARVASLEAQNAELWAAVSALQSAVAGMQAGNDLATALVPYVNVETDPLNGVNGPHVLFTGVNVHVRSGSAVPSTYDAADGLGNLIVGWNEPPYLVTHNRLGSNNLVVGGHHQYSSIGGFVAGAVNTITQPGASVSGGSSNTASGLYSSVSGGEMNTASGRSTSVSGGAGNTASGEYASSVSGGMANTASGNSSSVSAGHENSASGVYSSVSGGIANTASNFYSTVSGGENNTASGNRSTVSGGANNTASELYSHVP